MYLGEYKNKKIRYGRQRYLSLIFPSSFLLRRMVLIMRKVNQIPKRTLILGLERCLKSSNRYF